MLQFNMHVTSAKRLDKQPSEKMQTRPRWQLNLSIEEEKKAKQSHSVEFAGDGLNKNATRIIASIYNHLTLSALLLNSELMYQSVDFLCFKCFEIIIRIWNATIWKPFLSEWRALWWVFMKIATESTELQMRFFSFFIEHSCFFLPRFNPLRRPNMICSQLKCLWAKLQSKCHTYP